VVEKLLQNKYLQALLVFFAVMGIYAVIQSGLYYFSGSIAPSVTQESEIESMDMEMEPMDAADSVESTGEIDYTGTHIMPDGSVMTGSGLVIDEATILEDGTIELPDGAVLTPVADFRK